MKPPATGGFVFGSNDGRERSGKVSKYRTRD